MPNRRHLLKAALPGLWLAGASPAAFAATRLEPTTAAGHALNRLGFGPRPGQLAEVARDVPGWIEGQLNADQLPLPSSLVFRLEEQRLLALDLPAVLEEFQGLIQANQQAAAAAGVASVAVAGDASMAPAASMPANPSNPLAPFLRNLQTPALASRLLRALESPQQLREVMVDFWFNHFNVFRDKNLNRVLVGHYELTAIRPHALGRFADLLKATAHHPAMLYYLDNWQSVAEGTRGQRGLNENYARELMELHTLGVDSGYSQSDVTQLARMLTGWSIGFPRARERQVSMAGASPGPMSGFAFYERAHDAGEKLWLGHTIAPAGKREGDFALERLAEHPATARHIAFKLAQYFVADAPEPALVQHLAQVFKQHDGQIVPVLRALFRHPAFWAPAAVGAKFKTPYHHLLSTLRAGGYGLPEPALRAAAGTLAAQGMPLHGCATPDGYKNTEGAWLNPDAMAKRINLATQVASGRLGGATLTGGLPLPELLNGLGPLVGPTARALAERHQSEPVLALSLVLGGPGMMRR
jgi:uncharacterized protein (DUF1800 family)